MVDGALWSSGTWSGIFFGHAWKGKLRWTSTYPASMGQAIFLCRVWHGSEMDIRREREDTASGARISLHLDQDVTGARFLEEVGKLMQGPGDTMGFVLDAGTQVARCAWGTRSSTSIVA